MARRHLNQEQRRGLIQAELKDRPQVSDRQIAKALGVSHPTVATARKGLEEKNELVKFTSSIGADGKERPRGTAVWREHCGISATLSSSPAPARAEFRASLPPFQMEIGSRASVARYRAMLNWEGTVEGEARRLLPDEAAKAIRRSSDDPDNDKVPSTYPAARVIGAAESV